MFSELAKQKKNKPKVAQKTEQNIEQKSEQVSTQTNNPPLAQAVDRVIIEGNVRVSKLPTQKQIKQMSLDLSEEKKVKVNTHIPESWDDELDRMRRKIGKKVGSYEFHEWIIGKFLGKI